MISVLRPLLFVFASCAAANFTPAFAQNAAFNSFGNFPQTSQIKIDYSPTQKLSDAYSIEQNGRRLISYDLIRTNGSGPFKTYLNFLSQVPLQKLNRNDQLAHWLNCRNIMVVYAISEFSTFSKFKSERGTPQNPGAAWTKKHMTVNGIPLSIHDIEVNILMAHWKDTPNLIYGLYQGSPSGPSFQGTPFDGKTVQNELNRIGKEFVNSSNGITSGWGKVSISEIYDWYKEPLFSNDDALKTHLAKLAEKKTVAKLNKAKNLRPKSFKFTIEALVVRQANDDGFDDFENSEDVDDGFDGGFDDSDGGGGGSGS